MSKEYVIQGDNTGIDRFLIKLTNLLDRIYDNKHDHSIFVAGLSGGCKRDSVGPGAQLSLLDSNRTSDWHEHLMFYRISIDLLPEYFNLERYHPSDPTPSAGSPSHAKATQQLQKGLVPAQISKHWDTLVENKMISHRNNARVYELLWPVLGLGFNATEYPPGVFPLSVGDPSYDDDRPWEQCEVEYIQTHLFSPVLDVHGAPIREVKSANLYLGVQCEVRARDALVHCCRSRLSTVAASHFDEFCNIVDERVRIGFKEKLYKPSTERSELIRECENTLRDRLGIPLVGDGYVQETMLAKLITSIHPDTIRQYSPDWLGNQRIDIYVPSLSLAIEYNGAQHYHPVDFFGGEEGLKKTKERDRRKKRKCKANGVTLVEWPYTDEVTIKAAEVILKFHSDSVR